jgi:hypothetical protein
MRSLVLGAFILASCGLTANAAEPSSDTKAASQHARRPACQMVTADRTLRLLRDILPGDRRIAINRPMSRPVSTPRPVMPVHLATKPEPTHVVSRSAPARFVSRAEVVHLLTQHVSLVVGIGF